MSKMKLVLKIQLIFEFHFCIYFCCLWCREVEKEGTLYYLIVTDPLEPSDPLRYKDQWQRIEEFTHHYLQE